MTSRLEPPPGTPNMRRTPARRSSSTITSATVGIGGPPLAEGWLWDTPRPPRRGPAGQSGCSVALGATVLGCVLRGVRLRGLRGWRGLILRAGRHAFLELAHGLTERA